jgi:hypothetical protein
MLLFPVAMHRVLSRRVVSSLLLTGALASLAVATAAQTHLPNARPVPRLQAIPLPHHQVSFQRDGAEIARYHFDPADPRPFVFPVIGPSGRSLTRMGHPHDPIGHSHHNSFWITHNDVNGIVFWSDKGEGKILHQRVERLEDGNDECAVLSVNHWVAREGKVLLEERRRTAVRALPDKEWLLLLDVELHAKGAPVTFGKSAFGLVGVRMAKTLGVNDGGGTIRNSEGHVDEKGDQGCFWKRAKWCDYSGPITTTASEGLTLMDHPANVNHPTHFHVRVDGWMGSSLSFDGPLTIETGKPLRLRYGLYIHAGVPDLKALEKRWQEFAALPMAEMAPKKK